MRWLAGTALVVVAFGFTHPARAQQTGQGAQQSPNGWTGEFSLGGSLATGNTQRKSSDLDLRLNHREGRLEDRFHLGGTIAWETGNTVAQRVEASAQSRFDWKPRTYTFGLAEFTDDRFSGYRYEGAVSAGIGYRLIDTPRTSLTVDAGPGYRIGAVKAGEDEKEVFARLGSNFRYDLSDNARITNDAVVTYDAVRTRAEDTVAVTSKLIGNLAGRASFNVRYNSHPPEGIKGTDTLTKLSLVYGF